jgi:hypothetical protein
MRYGKFLQTYGYLRIQKERLYEDPDDGHNQIGDKYLARKFTYVYYELKDSKRIIRVSEANKKEYEITVIQYEYTVTRRVKTELYLLFDHINALADKVERML